MMLMETNDIETLIERFLNKNISGKEMASLFEWVSESSENMSALSSRMKAWAEKDNSFDADEAFERFRGRVAEERALKTNASTEIRHWRLWRTLVASAAAAAAVVVIAHQASQAQDYRNMLTENSLTVEAPAGSKTKVVLPDSSTVWLNAGSSLRYSFDAGEKERKVALCGEGFFEVRHNDDVPFVVNSTNLNVRVLGTKFNFCDYPEDTLAEVTLTQGSIALCDRAGKELLMSPDERVVFNKVTGIMTLGESGYDADEWITGNLTFDEVPLLEIVRRLERTYSVRIRIGDAALYDLRFYGSFNSARQDVTEVLRSLSATGKFRYKKEGDEITLY